MHKAGFVRGCWGQVPSTKCGLGWEVDPWGATATHTPPSRAEDRVTHPGVHHSMSPASHAAPEAQGELDQGPPPCQGRNSRLKKVPDDEEEEGQGEGDVEIRGFGIDSSIPVLQVGPGEVCWEPEPFPPKIAVQGLKHAGGGKENRGRW